MRRPRARAPAPSPASEQRKLATAAGVPRLVLFADKLQIAESVPLYPYLVKLGDLEKFRFLLDR